MPLRPHSQNIARSDIMKSKTIVETVLVLLLATIQPATCDLIIITKEGQASTPQVFRILVVEGDFKTYSMTSGQLLINALLGFSNWDNSTTDYVSYIHLLSQYGQDEVMDECKPYWKGESIKANVEYEFQNFLASASPNETVIFYFCGEGSIGTVLILYNPHIRRNEGIYPAELTSWLSSGGLPEANVCVILDSCASGSWIDDGEEPGGYLGPGRIVLCSSLSNQESYGSPTGLWTYFTGYGPPKIQG